MLKLIIQNTGSNIIVFGSKLVITFIMTPIFVKNLGNYDYGIWEVIGSVLGYMGLLDIGIRPTSSRFAAYYKAKNDRKSLIGVYSTALLFMFYVSLFLFVIMVVCTFWKPDILAHHASDTTKYAFVIIVIACQVLFVFPGEIAESYLEGFQQYQLKNRITLINSILGSALIYHFINESNALFILALINACGLSIKGCIYMHLLSRPRYGEIRFSFSAANIKTLMVILHFGVKSFIQGAAYSIANASNAIILAYILNPAVIIFYSIPANLIGRIITIRMLLTHAFMPLFSQYLAEGKVDETKNWFLQGSKYITGILLLIIFGALFLGLDFIRLWIGASYAEDGKWILYLLCITNTFVAINPLFNRYLTGVGKHGYLAKINTLTAIFSITLSILLTFKLGLIGVVIGSLLPTVLSSIAILKYTCRSIGISVSQFLKNSIYTLAIPLIAFSFVMGIMKTLINIDSYIELVSLAFIGTVTYLTCFIKYSLSSTERSFMYKRITLINKRYV